MEGCTTQAASGVGVTSAVCGNTAAQLMNTDPLHVGWCAGVRVGWTVLISVVVICGSHIPL